MIMFRIICIPISFLIGLEILKWFFTEFLVNPGILFIIGSVAFFIIVSKNGENETKKEEKPVSNIAPKKYTVDKHGMVTFIKE